MAIHESVFTFCDAQTFPASMGVIISTYVLNMAENIGFEVTHKPCYIVASFNTVDYTGTSVYLKAYRHSSAAVESGTLLLTSEIVTTSLGIISANPRAEGGQHYLAVWCMPVRMDRDYTETDQAEYFGLSLGCTGNCSAVLLDAYLTWNSPLVHTKQVNSSAL